MGNTTSRVEFSFSPLLNHVMSLVSPLNENSSQKMTLMEATHFAVKVQRWTYSNNNPQNDIRKWLLVLGWCIGLNLIDNNVKVRNGWWLVVTHCLFIGIDYLMVRLNMDIVVLPLAGFEFFCIFCSCFPG